MKRFLNIYTLTFLVLLAVFALMWTSEPANAYEVSPTTIIGPYPHYSTLVNGIEADLKIDTYMLSAMGVEGATIPLTGREIVLIYNTLETVTGTETIRIHSVPGPRGRVGDVTAAIPNNQIAAFSFINGLTGWATGTLNHVWITSEEWPNVDLGICVIRLP